MRRQSRAAVRRHLWLISSRRRSPRASVKRRLAFVAKPSAIAKAREAERRAAELALNTMSQTTTDDGRARREGLRPLRPPAVEIITPARVVAERALREDIRKGIWSP